MIKNLLLLGAFFLVAQTRAQTIADIDGNTYNTITIGTQTWMKENLKTTRFNNGDLIPTTSLPVNNDSNAIYQWAYNDDATNANTYGLLYSWFAAVDSRAICPVGWHIPNDSEWMALSVFLGGDTVAGNKLKETGTTHWQSTDTMVDNSSGFTGLPGGLRGNPSGFSNLGKRGNFWSSDMIGMINFARGSVFALQHNDKMLSRSVAVANCGIAIRCIKNLSTGTERFFPDEHMKLRFFPNPATDQINVSREGNGNIDLSIYNITGALVLQQQLASETNLINLGSLPKGIYIIKMVGADFSVQRKLIKE